MPFQDPSSPLPSPKLREGNQRDLRLESTLADLPLYDFKVDLYCPCADLARVFDRHPLLPGVILWHQAGFVGAISRQRLLDILIRPRGIELFYDAPLEVVYSYMRSPLLILPEETPIVEAARQSLRRSPELLGEPVVVRDADRAYWLLNIHELNVAYWQIRGIETQSTFERLQAQMIQTEKMASLGRLVDGIAHEILDPVGFIWGNLAHVVDYTDKLTALMDLYKQYLPEPPSDITAVEAAADMQFVQQDLPKTIASIRRGAKRIKDLATSLQNFCHIDEVYPKPADIHSCLDSVLLLLQSRLTSRIAIVKDYASLPPVNCYVGQLGQVFMNLLSNAIDASIERAACQHFNSEFQASGSFITNFIPQEAESRIEITTRILPNVSEASETHNSRWISIKIFDNSSGMSEAEYQEAIASFTASRAATKETSLALSYWIITAKHGGKFYLRSRLEEGTEVEILLPLT